MRIFQIFMQIGSKKQKKEYLNFFMSLKNILPCKYCRINFTKNIKKVPLNMKTMKNNDTAFGGNHNNDDNI